MVQLACGCHGTLYYGIAMVQLACGGGGLSGAGHVYVSNWWLLYRRAWRSVQYNRTTTVHYLQQTVGNGSH